MKPVTGQAGARSPRWAVAEGFHLTKNGRPYLDRLRIIQTPWCSLLLHRIHTADTDPDPHDHPWPFASLVLSGSYDELIWDDPAQIGRPVCRGTITWPRRRHHSRWSLMTVRLGQAHTITAVHGALWTLVLTGRRRPSWRFWTQQGPVDWRDYLKDGTGADDIPL